MWHGRDHRDKFTKGTLRIESRDYYKIMFVLQKKRGLELPVRISGHQVTLIVRSLHQDSKAQSI